MRPHQRRKVMLRRVLTYPNKTFGVQPLLVQQRFHPTPWRCATSQSCTGALVLRQGNEARKAPLCRVQSRVATEKEMAEMCRRGAWACGARACCCKSFSRWRLLNQVTDQPLLVVGCARGCGRLMAARALAQGTLTHNEANHFSMLACLSGYSCMGAQA